MKTLRAALTATALFTVAGTANALLIDDFNGGDDFLSITVGTPAPQSNNTAWVNAVGGSRTLTISTSTGLGPSLAVQANQLGIGNPPGAGSTGSITWNNNGSGLGGADLTDSGINDAVELDVVAVDVGTIDLTLIVTDLSGNMASLTLTSLNVGTQGFLFSSFVQSGGNTDDADFTNVASIILSYDLDDDQDVTLDLIRTRQGVPVPGTLALFGAGLIGLGMRRRAARKV